MAVLGDKPDVAANGRDVTIIGAVTSVDELRVLSPGELMDLYFKGLHPTSVKAVEGDPAGIAVGLQQFAGGRVEAWLRKKADSGRFVWHGKSFRSFSDLGGWGFNRLGLGPVLTALPFRTAIVLSVFDGEPCIALDYGVGRNPRVLRRTWDELREVMPGIFIGPVTVPVRNHHVPIAWFGVDTTRQSPLIGA